MVALPAHADKNGNSRPLKIHDLNFDKQELTDAQESALLEKYLPQIYVSFNSARPVDFEEFYLPHSVLFKGQEIIKKAPTADDIKPHELDRKNYYVDFRGKHQILKAENQNVPAPLYGRVYYEKLNLRRQNKLPEKNVIILKYNAVFTMSGLPKKLGAFQNFFSAVAGNRNIWHELDMHGAIHIMLDYKTLEPMALLLAQHNHFRSYIFNHDVNLPSDNHIDICYSIRSNEPYLCPKSTHHSPTVGNPSNFTFVVTGKNKPAIDGGYDVIEPIGTSHKMTMLLKRLDDEHPIYTAHIPLGDKRRILGIIPTFFRRGAPGIDLYAPPQLKKFSDLIQFFYFEIGDENFGKLVKESFKGWDNIEVQKPIFHNHIRFIPKITSFYKP